MNKSYQVLTNTMD